MSEGIRHPQLARKTHKYKSKRTYTWPGPLNEDCLPHLFSPPYSGDPNPISSDTEGRTTIWEEVRRGSNDITCPGLPYRDSVVPRLRESGCQKLPVLRRTLVALSTLRLRSSELGVLLIPEFTVDLVSEQSLGLRLLGRFNTGLKTGCPHNLLFIHNKIPYSKPHD